MRFHPISQLLIRIGLGSRSVMGSGLSEWFPNQSRKLSNSFEYFWIIGGVSARNYPNPGQNRGIRMGLTVPDSIRVGE